MGEKIYYFNSVGVMQTGLQGIDGEVYYFYNDGPAARYKELNYGGKNYYFDAKGKAARGFIERDGKTYYYSDEYVRSVGLIQSKGEYYYLINGKLAKDQWRDINGKRYYFDSDCKAKKGSQLIDGNFYYFNSIGVMQAGFVSNGGYVYYYQPENGTIYTGWLTLNGYRYYFQTSGQMAIGEMIISGKDYYFDEDGKLDEKIYKKGKTYYDRNGNILTGWHYINDKKKLFNCYGEMVEGASSLVIDISEHNARKIDWVKLKKNAEVDGVILRAGVTLYRTDKTKRIDNNFNEYYEMCKKYNIPIVGVYWYSCACTVEEAKEEAFTLIQILKDKDVNFPVYIDTEDNHNVKEEGVAPINQAMLNKKDLTEVVEAFLEEIEKNNYIGGIYASTSWFNNHLDMSILSKYNIWVAQYGSDEEEIVWKCTYKGKYNLWQYTSLGTIDGIKGYVDLNAMYN